MWEALIVGRRRGTSMILVLAANFYQDSLQWARLPKNRTRVGTVKKNWFCETLCSGVLEGGEDDHKWSSLIPPCQCSPHLLGMLVRDEGRGGRQRGVRREWSLWEWWRKNGERDEPRNESGIAYSSPMLLVFNAKNIEMVFELLNMDNINVQIRIYFPCL